MANEQLDNREQNRENPNKHRDSKHTQKPHEFGERIQNPSPKEPAEDSPDRYGDLVYREHDEFGEWLGRNN